MKDSQQLNLQISKQLRAEDQTSQWLGEHKNLNTGVKAHNEMQVLNNQ